jgi:hypothetical protein
MIEAKGPPSKFRGVSRGSRKNWGNSFFRAEILISKEQIHVNIEDFS